MTWTVTVIDRFFGKSMTPCEYWIHRENESIRTYKAQSAVSAYALCHLLNNVSEEQLNAARNAALAECEENDAA